MHSERRYLYDGWNLVAEYSVSGSTLTLVRSYTWGLDLASSMTATGGVGALVQIHDYQEDKTFLPAYDGNGNVVALADAATGSIEATYEYSPFGELIRCEGDYAKENPFRFSTKFHDQETGLIYYGMRYYSSTLGRFINRDPIEESGGRNLYGFVGNNGVNRYDMLGMYTVNEIYEDAPDADVFQALHPGYQRINENTWYDPERDHRIIFMGWARGDDTYNAHADEDMGFNAYFGKAIWEADDAADAAWYGSLESTVADLVAVGNAVHDRIDAAAAKEARAAAVAAAIAAAAAASESGEEVIAATGDDYFGSDLVHEISDERLKVQVNYSVRFTRIGGSVPHVPYGGRMTREDAAQVGVTASIGQESGKVLVTFNITVHINSAYEANREATSMRTQYGEYQHVRDFSDAIRDGFPSLSTRIQSGGEMGKHPRFVAPRVEAIISAATAATVKEYDGDGNQHGKGGTLLRPSDFPGYPDSWWPQGR